MLYRDMYHYLDVKGPIYFGYITQTFKKATIFKQYCAQLCNVKTLMQCNIIGKSYNCRNTTSSDKLLFQIISPCWVT